MIIAIDFDGTCVTHDFPRIGKDIGAMPVLRQLADNGHLLILNTMRSNKTSNNNYGTEIVPNLDNCLNDAIEWFSKNHIPLYGIQKEPQQHEWTDSPKCYAELYIDDAALGVPLKQDNTLSNRPFVDWEKVYYILVNMNLI